MKRILLITTLLLHFGLTHAQISKFQRIAIPATSFRLSPTEIAKNIPSFCSDFNRASPGLRATNFDFVHLDEPCVTIGANAPITLQEALDNKFIELEVNGYESVRIKNLRKTDETIKIEIQKNIVVGDVKNDIKNIFVGKELKHTSGKIQQIKLQQDFWEKQSQIKSLTDLNYLKESDINNAASVKEAIKKKYVRSAHNHAMRLVCEKRNVSVTVTETKNDKRPS